MQDDVNLHIGGVGKEKPNPTFDHKDESVEAAAG